jgi:hypothetical protein
MAAQDCVEAVLMETAIAFNKENCMDCSMKNDDDLLEMQ